MGDRRVAGPAARTTGACRPRAALALDFLAVVPVPATSEVAMILSSVAPVSSVPDCLLSLDSDDLLQPAPALLAGGEVEADADASLTRHPLRSSPSKRMEAAACLASPFVLEENAGAILRSRAAELFIKQEANLEMR